MNATIRDDLSIHNESTTETNVMSHEAQFYISVGEKKDRIIVLF